MSIIYEPSGKAREYSPLALNLYLACSHHCLYCYVPNVIQKPREEYFQIADPRKNLAHKLRNELRHGPPTKQVFLSFVSDPYSHSTDDNAITRQCLEALLEHNVPVSVLTKSGPVCLKDLDLFKAFGDRIQVGASLTFYDQGKSNKWESGAASPQERLDTLRFLKQSGIKTWGSFEPVIEADETLHLLAHTIVEDSLESYKIGKINNFCGLDKRVDWPAFLTAALAMVRPTKKKLYVKQELRAAAPQVPCYGDELEMDAHHVG